MEIGGFVKNSFVDFPSVISSVVFTKGCNFDCWYCHNKHLIDGSDLSLVDEKDVFDYLQKHKNMIEGVVVTGGEPTLQKDLTNFIKYIKKMGFLIKLDTNGTNPEVLENLLKDDLLDFVAMDIKTTFEKYPQMVKRGIGVKKIRKSISLILSLAKNYEFRTTFTPDISVQDISEISSYIKGAKAYALQKFRSNEDNIITIPHSKTDFVNAQILARKNVENTFIRGY